MTNPTPAQFYAPSHRGNRFGVEGPLYGPHGHLGQDFNGWPQGTIIPSWLSGEVVSTGWSPNLGWFVTVLGVISNGPQQVLRYVSFCHMSARGHNLGRIEFGDPVGPIGETGALAAGVHVHIPVALSKVLGGYDVEDPLPYITHAIGGQPAGGNELPLDNSGDSEEEEDMKPKYIFVPGLGRVGYLPMGPVWLITDAQWAQMVANYAGGSLPPELSSVPTISTDTYQSFLYVSAGGFPSTWNLIKSPVWRPSPTAA